MLMNAEIQRLQAELGLSRGELLQIAREVAHDSMVRSYEHMAYEDERQVIAQLWEIRVAIRQQEELELACA